MDEKMKALYEKRVEEIDIALEKKYGSANCIMDTTRKAASLFVTINNSEIEDEKKEKIANKAQDFFKAVVKEIQIRDEYFYESGYEDGKNEKKIR